METSRSRPNGVIFHKDSFLYCKFGALRVEVSCAMSKGIDCMQDKEMKVCSMKTKLHLLSSYAEGQLSVKEMPLLMEELVPFATLSHSWLPVFLKFLLYS